MSTPRRRVWSPFSNVCSLAGWRPSGEMPLPTCLSLGLEKGEEVVNTAEAGYSDDDTLPSPSPTQPPTGDDPECSRKINGVSKWVDASNCISIQAPWGTSDRISETTAVNPASPVQPLHPYVVWYVCWWDGSGTLFFLSFFLSFSFSFLSLRMRLIYLQSFSLFLRRLACFPFDSIYRMYVSATDAAADISFRTCS